MKTRFPLARLLTGSLTFLLVAARASSPVTVSVASESGPAIPDDFAGLSFEMEKVLPDANGGYYFSPTNKPLITLFQTLGIRSLRVGGNTADRPSVKVPSEPDVDSLFAFAKAADAKVIYTLRLREGNMAQAVTIAKYIHDHYQDSLSCFGIGNEPNVFAKEYPIYRDEWKKYVDAITAPGTAPDAKFCGPSATPGKASWARDFINDFGKSGKIAFVSQHDYPGGAGNKATNVVAARDKMLSATWLTNYEKLYASFATDALSNGLTYRLEEANNFYNGGAKDVSDTFAAALWGLDYLHWWAAHQAAGINFHTGDQVAAGEKNNPCRYATFWTSPSGYNVHPLGYGIKAFDLGGHGRSVETRLRNPANLNLTAYWVVAQDNMTYVTLINKEHDSGGREGLVTIAPPTPCHKAEVAFLATPKGEVAATNGVTLAGAPITDDGNWKGIWQSLPPLSNGDVTVNVPAASAAVVRLQRR
jgi:hypothetical protein